MFNKTGTLTKGVFAVSAVHTDGLSEKQLLHLAAHVERYSNHPIADSLRNAYQHEDDDCKVEQVEELAGLGIKARVNDKDVWVGNAKLMDKLGVDWHECDVPGTMIHVAVAKEYAGHIIIADVVKEHSEEAIKALKDNNIHQVVMLTGDKRQVAEDVAAALGVDKVYSELLPQDKVTKVEELLAQQKKGKLAFVGDGINDAPVLSRADVGIAMGAMGSDAAIEAADIVLMDDDPLKISVAQRIARKTLGIVRQNIYFSIGVKVLVLILGAVGLANMWAAIFADVGVMVLAVLNAMRALFTPKYINVKG